MNKLQMKNKCSILFISNSLVMGGAEKHFINLINQLDNNFFEFHLCYLKDITTMLPQINRDQLIGLFCADAKKISLKVGRLLADYVDQYQIDIILSTNMYPMIYAGLAKTLSKQHPLMMEVLHSTHLESFRNKLEFLFYRPLFYIQNKIVYVSENQRSYWRKKGVYPNNDCVIHNGIDADYFTDIYTAEEKLAIRQRYGFSQDDYLIGICAVLRPEKKHIDLLQAIKNMQISGIAAKCLIIGDGIERNTIERQIAELELGNHVKITGFEQDVRPLVASCDVMTLVSYTETFSISSLEAMSLKKPMVMSDIGGASEQVEEGSNGYLFQVGDVKALQTALTKLSNSETRFTFGLRSREIVLTDFTQEKMLDKFQKLFLDLQAQRNCKLKNS